MGSFYLVTNPKNYAQHIYYTSTQVTLERPHWPLQSPFQCIFGLRFTPRPALPLFSRLSPQTIASAGPPQSADKLKPKC